MAKKVRKDVGRIIEIPEGIEVSVANDEVIVKAGGKELKRKFDFKGIDILSRQVVSEIIEIKSFGVAIVEICK